MPALDSAIAALLSLSSTTNASVSSAGGGGCSAASTSKITVTTEDGSQKHYFMKSGRGSAAELMFKGEHASLSAIHNACPTLCPKSYGQGQFADDPSKHFLVTDYLNLTGRGTGKGSGMSFAQKLAKLHTTPAPKPKDQDKPQFGFPVATCCGDTPQDNTWTSSWADFFANRRLRFILAQAKQNGHGDAELTRLVEEVCTAVVPRLIGDDHLNNGHGVTPVPVHGDLWSGNASTGMLPGMSAPEAVIFDSSAVYAHSEYEFGIVSMFPGSQFDRKFWTEYHELVPKTEPVDEYEDRISLYELYHHLNHHALFGGYRSGAVSIMQNLLAKYGKGAKKAKVERESGPSASI